MNRWRCGRGTPGVPRPETIGAAVVGALLAACATAPAATRPSEPTPRASSPASSDPVVAEAEQRWDERAEPGGAVRAAAAWRAAAEASPEDAARWIAAARADHLAARAQIEADEPDEKAADDALARASAAATRALALLSPALAEAVAGDAVELPLEGAPPGALEAVYWLARAEAARARVAGYVHWVAASYRIREIMEQCSQRAPALDGAGPHRFLGRYFALPPSAELKDLERARRHFEQAAAAAPGVLENDLARAETLDVISQDRRGFEARIEQILAANVSTQPDLGARNLLTQKRARALASRAAELFE